MRVLKAIKIFCILCLPTTAAAFKHEEDKGIEEMIEDADAVIVATVLEVNKNAYCPNIGPQTTYTLSVEKVISGVVTTPIIEFTTRGGFHPDGITKRIISVITELTAGDTYILFIQNSKYVYEPFVGARNAILRIERTPKKEIVTDRYGHIINVSKIQGMIRGKRVTRSIGEIAELQEVYGQSNDNAILEDTENIINSASSSRTIIEYIEEKSKQKKRNSLRIGLRPQLLPETITESYSPDSN